MVISGSRLFEVHTTASIRRQISSCGPEEARVEASWVLKSASPNKADNFVTTGWCTIGCIVSRLLPNEINFSRPVPTTLEILLGQNELTQPVPRELQAWHDLTVTRWDFWIFQLLTGNTGKVCAFRKARKHMQCHCHCASELCWTIHRAVLAYAESRNNYAAKGLECWVH